MLNSIQTLSTHALKILGGPKAQPKAEALEMSERFLDRVASTADEGSHVALYSATIKKVADRIKNTDVKSAALRTAFQALAGGVPGPLSVAIADFTLVAAEGVETPQERAYLQQTALRDVALQDEGLHGIIADTACDKFFQWGVDSCSPMKIPAGKSFQRDTRYDNVQESSEQHMARYKENTRSVVQFQAEALHQIRQA